MNDALAELFGFLLDGVFDIGAATEPVARTARTPSINDRYIVKARIQIPGTVTTPNNQFAGRITATLLAGDRVVVQAVSVARSMALLGLEPRAGTATTESSAISSPQHSLVVRFETLDRHFELVTTSP